MTPPTAATPPAPSALTSASGLAKAYSPAETERFVTAKWDAARAFHARPDRVVRGEAKPYAIFIPPPNVTAALHLGHALNNTLQDVLARAHRMMGYETLWMPGTDHAGIATQAVVEKRLRKEGQLKGALKDAMPRDTFVAHVQAFKDEYEATITAQLKEMGCSCDWDRQRFTMDDQCAAAVREAFFQLFKDGLIYRGKRLVNWDPVLQTAVADDECYDEEIDAAFYYLRYPLVQKVEGTKAGRGHQGIKWSELAAWGYPGAHEHPADQQAWVTVATTRPETYLGDTAVAINPHDPRAKALRNLSIELPLVGRVIPIVEDSYVVLPAAMQADPEEAKKDLKAAYATGFLKVTPAHDPNDWEIGIRHKLAAINVMAPDATISDKHGWTDIGDAHIFVGQKRDAARKLAVKEFEARGLLEGIKPYRHSVKHSDRSKAIVEPYLSDQWYVRVTDERMAAAANRALVPDQRSTPTNPERERAGTASAATTDGQLRFYPPRYAKTFEQWHDGIRDWCISRQLWWGHRIPAFTVRLNTATFVQPSDTDSYATGIKEKAHAIASLLPEIAALAGLDGEITVRTEVLEGMIPSRSRSGHLEPGTFVLAAARSLRAVRLMELLGEFSPISLGTSERATSLRHNITSEFGAAVASAATRLGAKVSFIAQDPDVLDTWFSSALWPMSTLGWPDPAKYNAESNNGLLQAFNPSNVLCTAREIITLWVSRMVMFNRYFMPEAGTGRQAPGTGGQGKGPVPFKDVFIHAMIQDGEGRKMSKTLGNGVDPRDIIESHGADAMRFTLVQMTTNTQDVRMPVKKDSRTGKNTSDKFDNGRNYCNKLWNTARFVIEKLGKGASRAGDSSAPSLRRDQMSLLDRWMLSRLASTVKTVNQSLANYEFSDYAEAMYKLLWWDLCDWYLEGVKPTVEQSTTERAVLAHALETIVRLLHPIAPFITEAIFEQIRQIQTSPISGFQLGDPQPSGLLCTASWPRIDESWIDPAAEAEFESVRELITAVRNLRSQRQVPPKRRVVLHATPAARTIIAKVPGLVETLGGLERVDDVAAPGNKVPLRVGGEELFLSNLADDAVAADSGAEKDRITRELETLRKSAQTIASRLDNPGYAQRAPAKLVEESRMQLAKLQAEIAAFEAQLKVLG